VTAPIELPSVTAFRLLFAEICCRSSIGVVAPERSISRRVITVTGSAPSFSTRLMFVPVTSMLMSGAGAPEVASGATCATAAGTVRTTPVPATSASATASFVRRTRMTPPMACDDRLAAGANRWVAGARSARMVTDRAPPHPAPGATDATTTRKAATKPAHA
jgi:hypothetical protein